MHIFDEHWNEIVNPDAEFGKIEEIHKTLVYTWVVESPEQTHEEVIAEYPETGGKDIRIVVDSPEKGYWDIKDMDGNDLPISQIVPDDWSKSTVPVDKETTLYIYRPYTEEELIQRIDNSVPMETRISDLEAAVCSLYETSGAAYNG